MGLEREYSPKLAAEGVTIDERDVEMFDAIDRYGSMHRAADELGRSYARLQNRIVDLEDALGPLTERRRGGSGGGGTELTETARDLRRRFDRYAAELEGVAGVTESVLAGTVRERTGELATVETAVGPVLALVPASADEVQLTVRSDAVVLTVPDETPGGDDTSLRNRFSGTVSRVEAGDAVDRVTVSLDDDAALQALVTRASAERLGLEAGRSIVASFKATAARGIDVDASDRS